MRLVPDDAWAVLTLWGEVRGEPMAGKVAVARVIRNRMARHYFSDGTVTGTVLYPYQFEMWDSKDHNRRGAAVIDAKALDVEECREAWDRSATDDGGIGAAVLYYNPGAVSAIPSWAIASKQVAIVGAHVFFNA